jgi:predicted enzyme related to lactoylglutathione lyase
VDEALSPRLSDIIFDCADPERLATFWSALLNREIAGRKGPYVWLCRSSTDDYMIGFQRVPEDKVGKNRVHPDVRCEDVHETVALVEELGGSRLPGYERGGFLVMADPEGNEFCLLPENSTGMDDEGNAHYLGTERRAGPR